VGVIMPFRKEFVRPIWASFLCLTASCLCGAQMMQAPGTLPNGRRFAPPPAARPAQSTSSATPQPVAPQPVPTRAPSLLDQPAQAAKITVENGSLGIQAENSSLGQILQDLSSRTGMTIEGPVKEQRIFGTYGPGNPRDILSVLLADSGYNVMMVGSTKDGAPRELVLTQRAAGPVGNTAQTAYRPNMQQNQEEDDADDAQQNQNPPDLNPPQPQPGAVPPQNPATAPNGVKTPQQMLQELQQLRQQQLQEQQMPVATPPS